MRRDSMQLGRSGHWVCVGEPIAGEVLDARSALFFLERAGLDSVFSFMRRHRCGNPFASGTAALRWQVESALWLGDITVVCEARASSRHDAVPVEPIPPYVPPDPREPILDNERALSIAHCDPTLTGDQPLEFTLPPARTRGKARRVADRLRPLPGPGRA